MRESSDSDIAVPAGAAGEWGGVWIVYIIIPGTLLAIIGLVVMLVSAMALLSSKGMPPPP